MDDTSQEQRGDEGQAQPPYPDRYDRRRRRLESRRAARGSRLGGGWVAGAILIAIGIFIMLQNLGAVYLNNWWALFILIPAVGAFGAAWRAYQSAGGRLTAGARGSLIGGLILTLVTAIFLFGLDWGILGPVVIILAGIGILVNTMLPG